ncbi:helix-turn-helix domain-containing protein [Massilia glaciei]|uniref:AraC family transcriptional regulator n=1 Tax=Massilia glaciei TaxID=1524097 RepID=A0A2U2HHS5_9BURK|nr:helix-turn-helix transcriptional regulator [Massilia glaciei]PWF45435.1 AraC family transcriptional regulator [Massilia glaciei]
MAGPTPRNWRARWRAALFAQRGVGQPLRYWQEQAGVSPEHLARSCRRHYGDSPSGLLVRARLEWACDQLRRDDVRVVDLAYDAGFDNLSYFYRCFRGAYGCTPLDWLARERAGAVPF